MEWNWEKRKWIIPVLVPLVLFVLFNSFYSAPMLRKYIMQEKEGQIKDLANLGISIMAHFHSMEEEGQMTRRESQRQAASLIRDIRFGPEGINYYWLNDLQPQLIVHPFRPDLERVDLEGSEYQAYRQLLERFIQLVEQQGEGYIQYQWQYYGEQDRVEEKISYIIAFEPWGWIIGTGLYLHEVEQAARSQRNINVIFVITAAQILLAGLVMLKLVRIRQEKRNKNPRT